MAPKIKVTKHNNWVTVQNDQGRFSNPCGFTVTDTDGTVYGPYTTEEGRDAKVRQLRKGRNNIDIQIREE